MCLAQGLNAVMPVRLELAALGSRVKHSTTEPLCSLYVLFTHTTKLKGKTYCNDLNGASRLECVLENYFLYFSSKTNVVGTQKNRLIETVLLSTQNTCLN